MSESVFSNIRIWPVTSEKAGSLLANGKVVVAGTIQVNFTIMKGPKGPFAAFPSQMVEKDGEKKYYPHMNLLDDTTKSTFQEEVMAAYNEVIAAGPVVKPATKSAAVPF
jgi:DNA-binding cell septation regulator SpoVG